MRLLGKVLSRDPLWVECIYEPQRSEVLNLILHGIQDDDKMQSAFFNRYYHVLCDDWPSGIHYSTEWNDYENTRSLNDEAQGLHITYNV